MSFLQSLDPASIAVGLGIGLALAHLLLNKNDKGSGQINHKIQKNEPKVATVCQLKDIEDSVNGSEKGVVAYCRCWKSSKFPYCDGSHVAHNKETGDNTGPLVVKKN
eukprot:CAMPEP_0201520934 /NCGR_PEP_ID=MMETSP0161_2-20130828/13403_1 /ASSEMBLY_ACC=CAM_ASM_000251 /TAXON_ID=180227 /ORGANISM="Neoparamoeba aestuarina, Strain SoJaBio B1-5/56/2" /LENGTH=106 /DNA_ID=CAMNT_0047919463 /DNA_START=80 /DNA_END=400 /DNA_ORIENTATION=+